MSDKRHPNLFQQAVILSVAAHSGQLDKSSVPYILHPMAVASRCKTEDERIVAVLHDVVEDTELTLESLMEFFPAPIVEAVDAITHRKNEPYDDYLDRVILNKIALPVKIQDIHHNQERMNFLEDEETKKRLIKKYDHAIEFLREYE